MTILVKFWNSTSSISETHLRKGQAGFHIYDSKGLFRPSVSVVLWNESGTHLNFYIRHELPLAAMVDVNGATEINVLIPSVNTSGNARCEYTLR